MGPFFCEHHYVISILKKDIQRLIFLTKMFNFENNFYSNCKFYKAILLGFFSQIKLETNGKIIKKTNSVL